MSRRIDRDIPGPDWRLWPEQICASSWAQLFGVPDDRPLRLHVDIGFGRGEFLLELAQRDPVDAYVGIELDFSRVLKLARRLSRTSVRNIRLIGVAAEWGVREAFEPASVEAFWINFPDPWPKRRHQRRRLVSPRLVRELSERLKLGGSVHVATDDLTYASEVDSVLAGERLLVNANAPDRFRQDRTTAPQTAFEREWHARGRTCCYFHYRRHRADPVRSAP